MMYLHHCLTIKKLNETEKKLCPFDCFEGVPSVWLYVEWLVFSSSTSRKVAPQAQQINWWVIILYLCLCNVSEQFYMKICTCIVIIYFVIQYF